MYPQITLDYLCFLSTASKHQRNHPEYLWKSVRIAKKTPCNHLPFWHNMKQAWVIVITSILSSPTWGNYFGRPECWNSQISPGKKPSHPVTKRKTKNKTPEHCWENAASPELQDETKDILFQQHCTGGEETSMLHIQKAEDFDQRSSVSWAATVALAQPN